MTAGKTPTTGAQSALGTAPQFALQELRRMIVSGQLRPGERVTQEDVAAEVGLSLAPVREALRVLEQEGQVVYHPRRGYFVAKLNVADVDEIYALRSVLESRAARHALVTLDDDGLDRIVVAAARCSAAAADEDVLAELEANRRFHFAILDAPDHPHTLRLIQLLWDATEAYRALYYSLPNERREAIAAHDRILGAIRANNADALVDELDAHRQRALAVLRSLLNV
jgi:DNA-binding GntR family transcriptional regulator